MKQDGLYVDNMETMNSTWGSIILFSLLLCYFPLYFLPCIQFKTGSILRGSDILTIIIAEMVTPWESLPGIENVSFCTAVAQSTSP